MSISAIVAVEHMQGVNTTLEEQGWGKNNFSIPAYIGQAPSHGVLHAWYDPAFLAALEAIPYVTVENKDGEPVVITSEAVEAVGAKWTVDAPQLPDTGMVLAGDIYMDGGKAWSIIQSFDRSIYGGPAEDVDAALITYIRPPGSVEEWVQPIYAFNAYKLVNLYTGQPDEALFEGEVWYVVSADGAGNNVWQPGVYGWQRRA